MFIKKKAAKNLNNVLIQKNLTKFTNNVLFFTSSHQFYKHKP